MNAVNVRNMTLLPAGVVLELGPPRSELDQAYMRLKHACSDEELRESLDLIAQLQHSHLTLETNCGVKEV